MTTDRFPPDRRFPEDSYRHYVGARPSPRQEYGATEPPFDFLDEGIREVVRALWRAGFHPTDSGDGESKAELIAEGCALPMPHVFMVVPDPRRLYVPTEREQKVCSSKVKHATKQHAKTSATLSSRYGTKIHVYQCDVCNAWHLTAMPQELIRAARRTAP